jgi:hypothetical protein
MSIGQSAEVMMARSLCRRCRRRCEKLTDWGTCRACTGILVPLGLFPVLLSARERQNYPDCPLSIPLDAIAPHEAQALANHQQSLKTLGERGGLHPIELHAVMQGRPFPFGEETPRLMAAAVGFLDKIQNNSRAPAHA